ncbi:methyltransferase [uncultured Jatrophihabitans sp.]|uniref:DUF7782 domain-containing protein n=1 Tax=uncultured Jatrophihabitans sp. TaxID=1610747 RepID=UPI0035C9D6A5
MPRDVVPLLAPNDLDRLRAALAGYTVDAVHDALGLAGQAAHSRADLSGVARALGQSLHRGSADARLGTLVDLFLLGSEVDEAAARAAFAPLPLDRAVTAGVVEVSVGSVRATLEIRPYAETSATPWQPAPAPEQWWVVSDLGSDVRPGPLPRDHVLGVGSASLTLAHATPRTSVGSALDVGTGCGVQALHLSGHSDRVVATDVSTRALTLAATTAALSGQDWQLRHGSLLEPVDGEQYDLIVANPPFVVSAGGDGFDYRDSGLAGDGVCEALLRGLPTNLAPDGIAVLLANWVIPREGEWQERVTGWLAGRGCDAWIWQREVADPGEYVSLWLRDVGETPGSLRWTQRYDAWADWFDRSQVAAVGMGFVALRRHVSGDSTQVLVAEDVPQAVEQPVGAEVSDWFGRQRWLRDSSDDVLLGTLLRAAPDLVRARDGLLTAAGGWQDARDVVRQSHGLRWELEVDDAIAALIAGCVGSTPLALDLAVLAASIDARVEDVIAAALPVVRDLIGRGFLLVAA